MSTARPRHDNPDPIIYPQRISSIAERSARKDWSTFHMMLSRPPTETEHSLLLQIAAPYHLTYEVGPDSTTVVWLPPGWDETDSVARDRATSLWHTAAAFSKENLETNPNSENHHD